MRSRNILWLCGLALVALLSSALPAIAQEISAKDLFISHEPDNSKKKTGNVRRGEPGVRIKVELKRDDKVTLVPRNFPFKNGDKIRFRFMTNFSGYVRVINIGSSGRVQILYPYDNGPDRVVKSREFLLPEDNWYVFDENTGKEQLTFIFSSTPLRYETLEAVNGSGRPGRGIDDQKVENHRLRDLNNLAISNGRDLKIADDSTSGAQSTYAVVKESLLRRPIGIRLDLRHE